MSKEEEEAEMVIRTYWVCDVGITEILAIKCAIIHVEGMINNCESLSRLLFWQEVHTILKNK